MKVALVTGASKGIGAAIARRLAADGFAVALNHAGDDKPVRGLGQAIGSHGGRALPVRADVADRPAVGRMFAEIEGALGGVDVLVNNAGVMPLASIAGMDDAAFDRLVSVNLKGAFNTLREAA